MTAQALDDFLLRHAPTRPLPLAPALDRARQSLNAALAELRLVSDAVLETGWPWRGDEADVRYGLYRQYEALEDARARIGPLLRQSGDRDTPARPLVAAATAARWDLHGLLNGLDDADLDRDPGSNEWTLRQTFAHIVSVQRAYGWFTAWWLARRDRPADDFPERVPEDVATELPAEESEAAGTLVDTRRRLDEILDLSAGVFAPLGDDELAARARWSGVAVDVRFRIGRWSSHMREHTVQVEKTVAMLGRPMSEVERLLRLIAGAYGRLEEELYMRPSTEEAVAQALAMAESVAAGVAADASTVHAAAQRTGVA